MKPGRNLLNGEREDIMVLDLLCKVAQKVSDVYDGWIWYNLLSSITILKVNNFEFSIA